jgi:hypothetical protein
MSNHCWAFNDDAHDDGGGGSARNASRFVTPLTERSSKTGQLRIPKLSA